MKTNEMLMTEPALIPLTPESRLEFEKNYNRVPFLLRHALCQSELFSMPSLIELAQRLSVIPKAVYFNVGRLGVDRGWDFCKDRSFSALDALDRIEGSDAWMILKSVQREPAYSHVLHSILREVHQASRREYEELVHRQNISIIITSPNRITPYHIDADCNYLLQIHGSKNIHVFDGSDQSVVTPQELERFYRGDLNAAQYRPELETKAKSYELEPGAGIHVPVIFPHWVQNNNNVSVSASVNFCFKNETVPDLHRINHYLRRARLNPRHPGQSAISDSAKKLAANVLRTVGRSHRASAESN